MGIDIISVFNPPESKNCFLKDLACFGCQYRDECEDDWEEGYMHCEEMLENAKTFMEDHGIN